MTGDISDAARRLKLLREQAGLSMRAVAEHLGWTITRYQHYEDRYRRRFLPVELARALAELFAPRGIDPVAVMDLAGLGPGQPLPARLAGPAEAVPAAPRDLPVMGAVKGGAEGFYFNEGEPKEYVLRPAALAGASNAFALYVDGDSMEPRYFAGEVVYVNPNRPLSRGCFVAVEMKDGQGLIKQFVKRTDDDVVLRQFNPPRDLRLHARDVKQLYRIVGSAEG
ncbi:MAG: helix-turn-helix domain-containing protein [Rhodospirillaceae bacterium]|nr:helix-turn-helix domain-containing protein [Rhodospirillaceae bacterium]